MPPNPRQDNKSTRVGSGDGRGDIRFPSQKRGDATWKRFWKLFPKYAGFKSKREYAEYHAELRKREESEREANERRNEENLLAFMRKKIDQL